MNINDQLRIQQLELLIRQLKQKIRKLQKEYDECNTLQGRIRQIMEDFFSRRKRDLGLLAGAGLKQNRAVTSFMQKFREELEKGTGSSLSGPASSLEDNLDRKKRKLEREIEDCRRKIKQHEREIMLIKARNTYMTSQAQSGGD